MAKDADSQKRKAKNDLNSSPSKRQSSDTVRVKYRKVEATIKPVIATCPGTSVSSFLEFKSYISLKGDSPQDLLYASNHPSLNYTATRSDSNGQFGDHDKHYVAIYDPEAGQVAITEVKDLTMRGLVAEEDRNSSDSSDDGNQEEPASQIARRQALTLSFGTKKSKRMQQERTMNLTFQTAKQESTNSLSNAILASIPAGPSPSKISGSGVSTKEIMLSTKPFPKPDLTTADIREVYKLSKLIIPGPHTETLASMPADSWLDSIKASQPIQSSSRFVANRVAPLTTQVLNHPSSESAKSNLQLLRYISLLIEFSRIIRAGKALEVPSKWNPPNKHVRISEYSALPFKILSGLAKHYSSDPSSTPTQTDPSSSVSAPEPPPSSSQPPGEQIPTKSSITLLHTTILALSLHIPPPSGKSPAGSLVTDPSDIAQDLHLDPSKAREYFRGLGCRVGRLTVAEMRAWGVEEKSGEASPGRKESKKSEGQFVRLVLPLEFPAAKKGMPSKGMRGGR